MSKHNCAIQKFVKNQKHKSFKFLIPESKNSNQNQSSLNHTTATIAKELLNAGTSPTSEAIIKRNSPVKANKTPTEKETSVVEVESNNNTVDEAKADSQSNDREIRAADQLLYLADLLNFKVISSLFLFVCFFFFFSIFVIKI